MADSLISQAVYFVAPYQVEVRAEIIAPPQPDQMLVHTLLSAISPGTERLIYRGQVPPDLALDETLPDLTGSFRYPFKYGYALIGQVVALGADIPVTWLNRLIFAFHPHESHFITTPAQVLPLPIDISADDAVFLPNMETAVNFVLDGQPLIGERVAIFGQGIVGLLTTAVLAQFPLAHLVTLEPDITRRNLSCVMGASESLTLAEVHETPSEFDLIYELSGQPAALNEAISLAGFASRIVVGSWYGTKPVTLDLGGKFHRQRLRVSSSQVSTLSPELQGRWDKTRRITLAWQMIQRLKPSHLISHRFNITQAAQAYTLLDESPTEAVQIALTY